MLNGARFDPFMEEGDSLEEVIVLMYINHLGPMHKLDVLQVVRVD